MGMFAATVEAVKVKVAKSAAGSDVFGQVKAQFQEAQAHLKQTPGDVVPDLKRFPEVQAGQMVEESLLENAELLLDQLQNDGRRAMEAEVRAKVIEAVRDLKIKAIEQDGFVNPADWAVIKIKASALKDRVRQQLLSARMFAKNKLNPGHILDLVEGKFLAEAVQKFGRNWKEFQREAQAAIWAIAELRLQQLIK